MITVGEKWHCLAVKSYQKHYNVCKNHEYCYVEMPKEDNKILKCNRREKSIKVPFITEADVESLLENNEHVP